MSDEAPDTPVTEEPMPDTIPPQAQANYEDYNWGKSEALRSAIEWFKTERPMTNKADVAAIVATAKAFHGFLKGE